MRVIIADDEPLVRATLISMLHESALEITIVGEATNGEEAVELVKKCKPDLVFVDIRMPILNGLEAIRQAKPFATETDWIILTGYSDFEYAQQAINLGAANYLLKPVRPEELQRSLAALFNQRKQRNLLANKQFENEWMAALNGLPYPARENSESATEHFRGLLLVIDSHLEESCQLEHVTEIAYQLRASLDNLLTNEVRIALLLLSNGMFAVVGRWEVAMGVQGKRIMDHFLEQAEVLIQKLLPKGISSTILQTNECPCEEVLLQQFHQLQALLSLRSVTGIDRKWTLNELLHLQSDPFLVEISQMLVTIANCYKQKMYLLYVKAINDFNKLLSRSEEHISPDLKQNMGYFLVRSIGCPLVQDHGWASWFHDLLQHGERLLTDRKKANQSNADLVSQVIAYIEQHYSKEIGIGQIACQLNVSPNYLSTLFHKKTGVTFVKYLTQTRMLKAKELLTDPAIQVQSVAEQVGYFSTRHFTKLFTDYVGCYPSEYRKRFPREVE